MGSRPLFRRFAESDIRWGNKMFSRIRRQLTLLYTILTALALGSFALLFYFGLSAVLMSEQERDLKSFSAVLSHDAGETLKKSERKSSGAEKEKPPKTSRDGSNYTYYVLSTDGRIVMSRETSPQSRQALLTRAGSGSAGQSGVFDLEGPEGQTVRFLWIEDQVIEDGRQVGTILIAKDMAAHDHFLARLAQTLGGSSLIFLLLAGGIGHFASGRALVPIRRSFEDQQRFVADASHELRTPLSVIQASLDVVEQEDGDRLSPLSREIFNDLKDEVRRMTRLSSNLLTLARADSGAMQIFCEKIELRSVAEHVFRTMQPMAQARGITLGFASEDEIIVWADSDRITQLLYILLDNSLKFTPAGGTVSLNISRVKKENRMVALTVSDSGIGLSAEAKILIFERFYRVDKARTRQEGGAGLGLSIAAWIVREHGGCITVEDAENGGSIFQVLLKEKDMEDA